MKREMDTEFTTSKEKIELIAEKANVSENTVREVLRATKTIAASELANKGRFIVPGLAIISSSIVPKVNLDSGNIAETVRLKVRPSKALITETNKKRLNDIENSNTDWVDTMKKNGILTEQISDLM